MAETEKFIWVARGTWAPLSQVAVDPQRRRAALDAAKNSGARGKYRALVQAFAANDAATGAVPLVAMKMADGPPRRRRVLTDEQWMARESRKLRRKAARVSVTAATDRR